MGGNKKDKATPAVQSVSYLRSQVQAGKIPILEPGQEPPGQKEPPGSNIPYGHWSGAKTWCTAHGPALCVWGHGKRRRAEDVLLPGGYRGPAEFTVMGLVQAWRRPEFGIEIPPDGWIYGDLIFSDVDAVFIDAAIQPKPELPVDWGYPDLEVGIFRSSELRSLLSDHRIASGLYQLFKWGTWHKRDEAI